MQFYGRLLREGSNAAFGLSEESGDKRGMSSNSLSDGILGGLSGSTGSNSLVDLLGAGSSDFSSSLLSSFLSSGSNDDGVNSPLGLLGSFLSPPPETSKRKRRKKGKKKNGLDTLAKSVLTNLVKRLEDVETQELQDGDVRNVARCAVLGDESHGEGIEEAAMLPGERRH